MIDIDNKCSVKDCGNIAEMIITIIDLADNTTHVQKWCTTHRKWIGVFIKNET